MHLLHKLLSFCQISEVDLEPDEAFTAIILIAISAEGYSANQAARAIAILSRMQLFDSYSQELIESQFEQLHDSLERLGLSVLLKAAVASLPLELNETAFAQATDVVFAKGNVSRADEERLHLLYQALGISEAAALTIMEVMMIKNRG